MIRLALVLSLLATPVSAATDCPQNRAIYTERDNGYRLSFRPTLPWEASANTMTILSLEFPHVEQAKDVTLWGTIWLPNGTSHDRIRFNYGCTLPSLPDPNGDVVDGSTEKELAGCLVWEGVIFRLADNDVHNLGWFDDATAAETLLLPNLGPTIRYSGLVLSPGQEPHDVFTFAGCLPK
jgi:hypothetical protein